MPKTNAEIMAKLPEKYLQRLRLVMANYRIRVEDSDFIFECIQDCNEALEMKDQNYWTLYENVDENPIGV